MKSLDQLVIDKTNQVLKNRCSSTKYELTEQTPMATLGFDSVEVADLTGLLDHMCDGHTISIGEFYEAETIGDVVSALRRSFARCSTPQSTTRQVRSHQSQPKRSTQPVA